MSEVSHRGYERPDGRRDRAAVVRAAQSGGERALDDLVAAYLLVINNIVGRALDAPTDAAERQRVHGDFMWRQLYNVVRVGAQGITPALKPTTWPVTGRVGHAAAVADEAQAVVRGAGGAVLVERQDAGVGGYGRLGLLGMCVASPTCINGQLPINGKGGDQNP
nr:hypothetical protein [Streptomyces sp. GESEQ-35]